MSNAWSGGSSGGSNPWGGSSSSKKSAHHGLLHNIVHGAGTFVGHLGKDVEEAAIGLPMGLVNLARHPVSSLETIGKTTWQDWSPLFHGHFKEFGHNTFEHPLAPILDLVSVVTLGAGSGVRGAKALSEAGLVKEGSRLHKLAHPELDIAHHGPQGTVYRHVSANPATRGLQNAGRSAANRVMPNWRGGEYTRLIEKDTARRGVAVSHINSDVHEAMKGVFKAGQMLTHQPHEYFRVVDETMHGSLQRFARHSTQEHVISKVDKSGNVTLTAPKGVAFIRADAPKTPGIATMEDVDQHLQSFGKRHTVKSAKPSEIALDGKGNPLLVPDHNVNLLVQEARNSTKLTRMIYHNPTRIWKWAVLTTPRFFVNNAVGNALMAINAVNPVAFAKGTLTAIKDAHGNRAAMRAASEFDQVALKALGHEGDVIDKWYLGPHKEGFGYEASQSHQLYRKLEDRGADPRLVKAVKTGEQGLFTFTHRVAEKGIRRIGIRAILSKQPEVRALMKDGKSLRDAIDQASHDAGFRSRIQHEMDNVLGQYHYYNGLEQHLRSIVPFYGWDRAIMRHTRTMAVEKPGRTAIGAGLGQQGVEETKKRLGDIPSFLESLIPLGGSKVLSTTGMNPYASVPEVTNAVAALVGVGDHSPGEAISMQLNPFITGLIETTTGQSLLSGAKLPHRGGGIIGQTAANVTEGVPQVKLLETLLRGEQKPKANKRTGKVTQFLYRKDARTQIASLLGVPVKEINKDRANELGRKAHGEKKGRKRKNTWG